MRFHGKFSSYLSEIGWTSPTPALPVITVKHRNSVDVVYDIMNNAIENLSTHNAKMLFLNGFTWINPEKYFSARAPKGLQGTKTPNFSMV